ncbi:MAG TPA: PPC domain-containing DNA-binding protein [Thermoplasmata archaeon]|jgi:hypothetical protein|nr:PPC domain-containing DNA-binding protein [Thermoplasmata archaeon]
MQSSLDGDMVIAKLDDGDDLFARLAELATKHGLPNGLVMWAIGMLRDVEIGYFNGKEYERHTFAGPMELLSLHGTYAIKADPKLHLHVVAAGRDHAAIGGHLFQANVAVMNEVCMRRLSKTWLDRVLNPTTGFKELSIR